MIGLSDIRNVVRLMTLTAMNRIEIENPVNQEEHITAPFTLTKSFSRLATQISPAASSNLNNLSISIAALAQNDEDSSNMVVNMCTKDLIMSAVRVIVPKCGFAVTQALVGILSTHGGCSLLDLPKEDLYINTPSDTNGPLTLVNALSAFLLSNRVSNENREWAAEKLFKCIATRIQALSDSSVEQVNFADLSNTLPHREIIEVDGHDNRVCVLAYHETTGLLASTGYDATVRVWIFDNKEQPYLEHTFVFHENLNVYGCELHGKLIGHLKWAPDGDYIAAAMEGVINIWPIPKITEEKEAKEWFIDDQHEIITCMTWPKHKKDNNLKNYLIVGKIDGTVTLITIYKEKKTTETLINCSLSHSNLLILTHLIVLLTSFLFSCSKY